MMNCKSQLRRLIRSGQSCPYFIYTGLVLPILVYTMWICLEHHYDHRVSHTIQAHIVLTGLFFGIIQLGSLPCLRVVVKVEKTPFLCKLSNLADRPAITKLMQLCLSPHPLQLDLTFLPFCVGPAEINFVKFLEVSLSLRLTMEMNGTTVMAESANVIFVSNILGHEGMNPGHKCDWKCQNEHVCGNMYRCRLTGATHICDKNCDQRILYDNHSSLCRVSGQIFPFSAVEEQAVRGIRRKLETESSPPDSCSFKRRRDAKLHPSPFERSFSAVSPICSQVGDGMDLS